MNQKTIKTIAAQFRAEISRKGNQVKFFWSHTVQGPLDEEYIEYIQFFAGCWSENLPDGNVRFYCNNSHPSWKREEEKPEPIDYFPEVTRREREKMIRELRRKKREAEHPAGNTPRSHIRVRYF